MIKLQGNTVKELKERLTQAHSEAFLLSVKIAGLRNKLREICDHSDTEPYEWEHDNGYGRQTMIIGKRCVHCWFVDLWNRGNFVDPKDIG